MTVARSHLYPVSQTGEADLRALLDGVGRGEREAVGLFFDRFEREVNGLVWALLGADADHDDLVSEAFEAMVKKAGRVRNVAATRAWVRQVTVNTVRMELRRRRWRRLLSLDEEEALDHPDLRVPDEAERARTRALYRALGRLSDHDRTLLVLRHIEGLELTELAETLGSSPSTLKRHLVRAETRVAAILGRSES